MGIRIDPSVKKLTVHFGLTYDDSRVAFSPCSEGHRVSPAVSITVWDNHHTLEAVPNELEFFGWLVWSVKPTFTTDFHAEWQAVFING